MIDHPITRTVRVCDPETNEEPEEVKLLRRGLARRYINQQIGRIKRMFGWAVEEELLPVSVHQKGKSNAREKARIKPVSPAAATVILPLLPPAVRTMIEVQRLTGCRPQDVVQMRAADIDQAGPTWEYRPQRYKTEAQDEDGERVIFLGHESRT